ncbi:hypothetical protein [Streptomyces calvus]
MVRLRSVGYHVDCDEDFDTVRHPPRDLPLRVSVTHNSKRIRRTATTEDVADALTELPAPHDGILAAIEQVLGATAEFHDGLGAAADPHTARRLRHLAQEHLHVIPPT